MALLPMIKYKHKAHGLQAVYIMFAFYFRGKDDRIKFRKYLPIGIIGFHLIEQKRAFSLTFLPAAQHAGL